MSLFTRYTDQTAPQGAAGVWVKVKEYYDFIPNLVFYCGKNLSWFWMR